jgi:hypothetical protein
MIARRMRNTASKSELQAAAMGTRFIVSRPGARSPCIGMSPDPPCFSEVASESRRFAASCGVPPRNACHTSFSCFVQIGKRRTWHSSKYWKAPWPRKIPISFSCQRSLATESLLGPMTRVRSIVTCSRVICSGSEGLSTTSRALRHGYCDEQTPQFLGCLRPTI